MLKSQHSKAGYINYLMRFSAITTKHSRNNVRAIANKNYKKLKLKKIISRFLLLFAKDK